MVVDGGDPARAWESLARTAHIRATTWLPCSGVPAQHECSLHVCIRSCGAQWSVCLGALVSLLGPLVTGVKPDLT